MYGHMTRIYGWNVCAVWRLKKVAATIFNFAASCQSNGYNSIYIHIHQL